MSDVIKPTVGRKVHVYISKLSYTDKTIQPYSGEIVYVHSDRMVNLVWYTHDGTLHKQTSVLLVQPGDTPPEYGGFCAWIPFQIGQSQAVKEAQAAVTDRPVEKDPSLG